ncbi:CocE/NonD family hydrolase [Bradyrhizobium jicamae]|uniref:CocE/NonD family hydrolase n=1 Tax=Bradyrhizobium jicamae TaxID=280332 RepID=UPI001BA8DE61|nr:CocE/NonD family hydrolase [Bradyrhizobium jicamae]MBR0755734.1 CocE/NonD family hydrolase [Bradyrhizobium jicamae]
MLNPLTPEVVHFSARDGTKLAVAVYKPSQARELPTLFAASPYRFDNNALPASPQFLWRETGPIDFYVGEGYAYVHLDLRGCGRSEGEFGFLGKDEQGDLYDAIEWAAAQPWSNGKVGSIGQSYYCMIQWFLGALKPPSLACIGAHDGAADIYRQGCYHGGIPCDFFAGYWWHQNRTINRFPETGPARNQKTDLDSLLAEHPLFDDFWRERSAWDKLDQIEVPLYSSGVWGKHQLHTRGNIDGYQRARGPKKLRMSAAPNAWTAAAEFASTDFHRAVMLPFYDRWLKGIETGWESRPAVEFFVGGSGERRVAAQWPPAETEYQTLYLSPTRSGSVHSFNDGSLASRTSTGVNSSSYSYPDPGWVAGVVGFGPGGPASGFDPVRRVLTFTTPRLEQDLVIAGPILLRLYAASSNADTDFFIKLSDQLDDTDAYKVGHNAAATVVTRGWLRASHRELDPSSTTEVPRHPHDRADPLIPDQIYPFEISLEPQAYRFAAGHRIRLEIANGDSPVTEQLWPHMYTPEKIGTDTIFHDSDHPSCLVLPVIPTASDAR